jgi:predicted 3-demethylubiquinone-9 3-methyltransferase (glyoxalase superfamily)/RimJ/RimL family protein N-acetyltransferase
VRAIAAAGLVLEPQVAAHADEMFAVLSDPAIYEFENAPPQSLPWLRARFAKLESRRSPDGNQQWLNWVIRLPGRGLAGYVQATVHGDARASIAYELTSAHWGRGLGGTAVEAMMAELSESYGVRSVFAVLKRSNWRSLRLLKRLGFAPATPEQFPEQPVEADELLMRRSAPRSPAMQTIAPFLWFDDQAEEAAKFYTGIFPNSRIVATTRYGEAGKETHRRPPGSVMTVAFELDGQSFTALNGGPVFKFNEAVSLVVNCATQEEIDHYWNRLSQGGDPSAQQCGWLKDRFGVSWQVVPTVMVEMFKDENSAGSQRVFEAMMGMKKLDIARLKKAAG